MVVWAARLLRRGIAREHAALHGPVAVLLAPAVERAPVEERLAVGLVREQVDRMAEAPLGVYEQRGEPAQALLRQSDAIVSEANRRAEAILQNANETRDKLVHDSEVLTIAKKQASEIENTTQDYCENLRISVHQNLDKELYDIAVKMNETMMTIESLREELWKRSGGGGSNN